MRLYFWLQEACGEDFGDEFVARVNRMLLCKKHQAGTAAAARPIAMASPTSTAASVAAGGDVRAKPAAKLTFAKILAPDAVTPLLADPQVCARLLAHAPPTLPQTRDELESILRSPQFRQVCRAPAATDRPDTLLSRRRPPIRQPRPAP